MENYNVTKTNTEAENRTILPAVDITENKDGYVLYADMPGVSKENLEITIDNNELTIFGKNTSDADNGEIEYSEYSPLNYRRVFVMNENNVDTKQISASIDNGVLTLNLPKSEKTKLRKIEIKTA